MPTTDKETDMPMDLSGFTARYETWVEESLPDYRAHKMDQIVLKYPFVISEDIPWTPYTGEPAAQTFALITTGGIYLKESQPPYNTESIHGDPSFRKIPKNVRREELGIAHAHYDHSIAAEDFNTIFPIERFIELEREGILGKVVDTHYSFSYVNDIVPLLTKSVPEVIRRLKADRVGVLFLVPV